MIKFNHSLLMYPRGIAQLYIYTICVFLRSYNHAINSHFMQGIAKNIKLLYINMQKKKPGKEANPAKEAEPVKAATQKP